MYLGIIDRNSSNKCIAFLIVIFYKQVGIICNISLIVKGYYVFCLPIIIMVCIFETISSGDLFTLGQYPIVYLAEDNSNNWAQCSFDVYVRCKVLLSFIYLQYLLLSSLN